MSQMLKSSGAMGIATLSSRVLGMVREMIYARFMGDGWVASAFVMALMIPNLFRRLLGEGALTAAFVPIFKEKEKLEGDAEMWRASNAVISGLLVAAGVLTLVAIAGLSVALGWFSFEGKLLLTLQLLRVMFPYLLLACLTAIFMAMLNSRGHFFMPSLGSSVLNVVMISSVIWLAPQFGHSLQTRIFGLALGIVVAGVIQVLFQMPTLRREGYTYAWEPPWHNETVREVVRRMIPGTIGVAVFQINVLFTQGIAYATDDKIVASYNYAVRLMELPQGVFGISMATYLLTTLSGLAAEKKYAEFKTTLGQGLGYISYLNLGATAVLVVLAEPIMRLLFERGEFDAGSTQRAALALACLAPGLVAFSLANILARAFYALGDTKTPMQISMVCMVINLIIAVPLILSFKQGGLGLANSLSSLLNVGLLYYGLNRKLKGLDLTGLKKTVPWMLAAALFAGQLAWLAATLWARCLGHHSLPLKMGEVFLPLGVAVLSYWVVCLLLHIPQAHEFWRLLSRRFRAPPGR